MIGVVQIPQENIESVWALVDDAITKALKIVKQTGNICLRKDPSSK